MCVCVCVFVFVCLCVGGLEVRIAYENAKFRMKIVAARQLEGGVCEVL